LPNSFNAVRGIHQHHFPPFVGWLAWRQSDRIETSLARFPMLAMCPARSFKLLALPCLCHVWRIVACAGVTIWHDRERRVNVIALEKSDRQKEKPETNFGFRSVAVSRQSKFENLGLF
jgi:hypothetical protein